ncbi:hypothetical protein Strop_1715 [Salinispora tropica CNB-440]|uniref:Uncharacterized protein n=1 Tax=Salinispora tropica (strain ATCC BAA-916 / DSM 44818 / JCM 13857 / NBRC 105044 / CNB-440) TaxID=369723 RepID=A4X5M9_SALTO|nr:hypothetical protein Strop_1715 [Salinispora tropica CNB-440]
MILLPLRDGVVVHCLVGVDIGRALGFPTTPCIARADRPATALGSITAGAVGVGGDGGARAPIAALFSYADHDAPPVNATRVPRSRQG